MSDMLRQRRSLVEALYLKTVSGDIDWSDGFMNGGYSAEIGDKTIALTREADEDRRELIVTVYDRSFNVVEGFSDTSLASATPVKVSGGSYFKIMSDLYDMARRHSTGATKALNDILGDLGIAVITEEDDEIPF